MATIDLARVANLWQAQDVDRFHKLPVYFAKNQAKYLKVWSRWPRMLGSLNWRQNQGPLLRGVRKEPSPICRSSAIPQPITSASQKDVVQVRESSELAQVYKHDFESPLMHWLPSFQDWLTNHVSFAMEDLNEKIKVYHDLFLRTFVFHASPKVWICGADSNADGSNELKIAPHFNDQTLTASKTAAWVKDAIDQVRSPLTLQQLRKLGGKMLNDVGATPYTGQVLADGTDGKALALKYLLTTSTEVFDAFADDGFNLANKDHNLDIITGPFQGSLFGRWTSQFERFELRIAADGTFPVPELEQTGAAAYNDGEAVPNPAYLDAEYGVAFASGGEAYKAIKAGPPPNAWTNTTLKKFANLSWNGRVEMTQNVLVPSGTGTTTATLDTNKRGDYIQLIGSLTMGCLPTKRRNIVPIIYQRRVAGNANLV